EVKAADMIEEAIKAVLKDGYRTKDLAAFDAKEVLNTTAMGDIVARYVSR
ncbi:3-isopropylmalate dehydrogenase, partial [Arcobacter ellisii]